jgi:putative two-component system response regulator
MSRVLVADGDPLTRGLLRRCLETDGYEVVEAEDGAGALRAIRGEQPYDVLVADQLLGSLTGVELIAIAQETDPALPCLICTGKGDLELATIAMEAGAVGFVMRPFRPDHVRVAVQRAVERRHLARETVRLRLAAPMLERFTTILANTIEAKDSQTQRHCERLVRLSDALAVELGVDRSLRATVRLGACLHDVGKVAVPDLLLRKTGRLSADEWDVLRRHPDVGASLLADIDAWVEVRAIIRHHHERFDGSGYPSALAGYAIPLGARIVAVVDAFDVMRSGRPYRAARPLEQAVEELRRHRASQFDPDCVDAFLEMLAREPAGIDVVGTPAGSGLLVDELHRLAQP